MVIKVRTENCTFTNQTEAGIDVSTWADVEINLNSTQIIGAPTAIKIREPHSPLIPIKVANKDDFLRLRQLAKRVTKEEFQKLVDDVRKADPADKEGLVKNSGFLKAYALIADTMQIATTIINIAMSPYAQSIIEKIFRP